MDGLDSIGRREFGTRASVTAATAILTVNGITAAAAAQRTVDLKTVTAETFLAVIRQPFSVAGSTSLLLDSVQIIVDRNRAKRPKNIRQQSFSLLFSAPRGITLPPAIYSVQNAKLGRFSIYINEVRLPSAFSNGSLLGQAELFLGRVGGNLQPTPGRVYFEAPFN